MSGKNEKSNEALVILAQCGCEVVREKALDLLLRRNEGLIYEKALTYWNYVLSSDIDRSLTLDDLVQLGRIKFCEALLEFDPLRGTKLTTFMSAVLNNYLIDIVRPGLKEKEKTGASFNGWITTRAPRISSLFWKSTSTRMRKSRSRSFWKKSIGEKFSIR